MDRGIAPQAILRMIDRWEREDVGMHGFELRRDGALLCEGYWSPFEKGQPHRMYSVSKSMVSLAVGMLLGEGKLSLEERIVDRFPDLLGPRVDARLARLTLRDMLRMATCYEKTTYREYEDEDWAATFFTAAPTHEPGTMFFYDTSCSQVLGALCQRVSGKGLLEFLTERLFAPLGADDPKRWLTDPSGMPQGGTGLIMSLCDFGKVAQCVMDGGRGLVPAEYVAQATARQIGTEMQQNPEERFGYGYQFWRTRGGWSMYGMGGQLAVACPEEGVLLTTIADTRLDGYGVQRVYDAFFDEALAHMDDAPQPGAQEALAQRLASLRMKGLPSATGAREPDAARAYVLRDGPAALHGVTIERGAVTFEWESGAQRFAWERLGEISEGLFPGTRVPCLTSAGYTDDGALRVRCNAIGDAPCGIELLLCEREKTLSLRMRKSSDPLTNRYEGLAFLERA